MDLNYPKQQLRIAISERLAWMNQQERDTESRSICKRIVQQLPKDAINAAVYYPMKSEVDILPLVETLLKQGSVISMPRTEGRAFEFRQVTSLDTLVPGPHRILEPSADAPLMELAAMQYILVPGVAFDRECNRLGRGNGGYDKWLERVRTANPHVHIFGIAFEAQVANTVPMETHDVRMDKVITARETYGV